MERNEVETKMDNPIQSMKSGHVVTIRMNRPRALNAINLAMIEMIDAALIDAARDPDVRVLVITGADTAFCVGADIRELGQWQHDPSLRERFYTLAPEMFRKLRDFPHPVIAAVNGLTVAGGFELGCYADLIIAAEDAMIGDGHANFVGFGPVSAVLGPLMMPGKKVAELLFTGDLWTARDMAEAGFVNRVVPRADLMDAVQEIAQKIASKQPLALTAAKALLRKAGSGDSATLLADAFESAQRIFETEDFAEGLKAFEEKRRPVFKGR